VSFPFANLVRLGVNLADKFTENVQPVIKLEQWIGQDKFGKITYAAPTFPRCVIDSRQRMIVSTSGQMITVMSTLTFTTLPVSNGAIGRREPIDTRDKITLPDGFTGPIISVNGPLDPATNKGFILEVQLGAR